MNSLYESVLEHWPVVGLELEVAPDELEPLPEELLPDEPLPEELCVVPLLLELGPTVEKLQKPSVPHFSSGPVQGHALSQAMPNTGSGSLTQLSGHAQSDGPLQLAKVLRLIEEQLPLEDEPPLEEAPLEEPDEELPDDEEEEDPLDDPLEAELPLEDEPLPDELPLEEVPPVELLALLCVELDPLDALPLDVEPLELEPVLVGLDVVVVVV